MSEYNLSPCEWAVMSALWEKSPQPLSGVIETVGGAVDWNYRTYATYLRRLCDKGLVGFETRGRDKLYYPLAEKEACIRAEGRSLMQKLDGRAAKELLVYMIRESGLTQEDNEELQRLLDGLSKGGGRQ
jgi:BlaI family penicillinase repressor